MKSALLALAVAIVGAVVGGTSALLMSGLGPGGGPADHFDISIGGWASDWSIGDASASPYVRARIARHGLLALTKSEAVYFTRAADDDGRPLKEQCDYILSGGRQTASWWSITLYDAASRLPLNDDEALSVDMTAVDDAEDWSATISARAPDDRLNWISSRNAGAFDLTLRLYEPDEVLLTAPEDHLNPPKIERVSCAGGGR